MVETRHCSVEECPYVANRLGVSIFTCMFQTPKNLPYGIKCLCDLPKIEDARQAKEGQLAKEVKSLSSSR